MSFMDLRKKESRLDFSSLPCEILVNIITRLSQHDWAQVARTNKSLHAACDSELQERKYLDLKNPGVVLNDECFHDLARKTGVKIKRLELDCWHLSDASVLNLPNGIEELVLCGCDHHSDLVLFNVSERTRSNLKVFAWSGFGGTVSASGFEALSYSCRYIKSFMIDADNGIDVNHVICTIAKNCPLLCEISAYDLKMETLDTVHNSGINLRKFRHKRRHQGVLAISDAAIIALCRMAPMLEELQLVDKLGANQFRELTDIGLLALSEKSSTLHTLKLKLASPEYAVLCSEVAIMKLMCSCKNATQIELSNFKCLSDPPVYELVQNRFVLKDLTLEGTMITDVAIELIASCAKNLNSISVKGCRKLTEDGLKSLGQCRTLKSINVGHTYCLTDAAATDICLGNPFLKILVFSYGLISDSALKSISTCSHLEELALNNCFRVTNSGLKLIANGCLQLRYISVSYCERLSDSGIIALGNGCPRLQKVRLDGCRRLSNPCISVLSKNNIKLRHLSMQNCPKLSNTVFEYLLDAPAIRFISLGRAKLTQSGIEYYHLKKPLVELFIDGKRFSSYSTG